MPRKKDEVVPINAPSRRFLNSEFDEGLIQLLKHGPYLNGPFVSSFEKDFASFIGTEECVAVASGMSALELAISALGLRPEISILVPANAGGYASTAVKRNSFKCDYYDVNTSGLATVESLDKSLTSSSRLLVITHLYGQTAEMPEIMAWARSNNILVLEDCAQSAGSSLRGQISGSFGDLAAFSFYPTKNLGAIGDAGAICTNDSFIADELRSLRQYGWKQKYVSSSLGSNSRMDELQAFVLSNELKKLNGYNSRRRHIWRQYRSVLEKFNLQHLLIGTDDSSFIAHLGVLRLNDRQGLVSFFQELNIGIDVHYPLPDYKHPAFMVQNYDVLEITEYLSRSVISIPLFESMFDAEIESVSAALETACNKGLIA